MDIHAITMLAYVEAVLLLSIVCSVLFLILKSSKLTNSLEPSAENLSSELKDITGLLNELCDIIHEVSNSLVPKSSQTAQTGFDIPSLLTMFLNKRSPLAELDTHGDPKQEDWEILPQDDNKTTLKTEEN